ncbi:hypothetical protein KAR91_33870 [Candidatus Pacearchaeota archaeon]|nr:hypothetical protein [Candidatus Pacearchaeota archaeon]
MEIQGNSSTTSVFLNNRDRETKRRKAILLWMAGTANDVIADITGLQANTVGAIVKLARKEIEEYGEGNLRQLLLISFVKRLGTHRDTSGELIKQFVALQYKRDRLVLSNNGTEAGIEDKVNGYNDRLRRMVLDIGKNDLTFVDTIQKMGVPQVDQRIDNKGPTHPPPDYYSAIETSSEVIRSESVKSLQRQLVAVRGMDGDDKVDAEDGVSQSNKYLPGDGKGKMKKQ